MARTLNTNVHAVGPDGQSQVFGPGDEVPDWARKAITNPDVWDGKDDTATADAVEPPRAGKGSGVDAWRSYAESRGVALEDDMTRDDIIAAVDLSKE